VKAQAVGQLVEAPDWQFAAVRWLAGYGVNTRGSYATDLRQFAAWMSIEGQPDLFLAERAHVALWVQWLEEGAGYSRLSARRKLTAVASFYRWCEDEDLIERNPAARVKRPAAPRMSPQLGVGKDDAERLLETADSSSARDHALVCLLLLSGFRVSEAVGANIGDLGHERGHRTLRVKRKGGWSDRQPLASRTVKAIEEAIEGRDSDPRAPILVNATGGRLSRRGALWVVKRLCGWAGVDTGVSPHSLRRGFVTLSLDAGVPIRDVSSGAGHLNVATTTRYDTARGQMDRAATYTLADYLSGSREGATEPRDGPGDPEAVLVAGGAL
jgi:integrase/recombinase XerD